MRIAYICADRGIPVMGDGGSAVHVRELVGALTARGHDVIVFAADDDGDPGGSRPAWPIVHLGGDRILNELRADIGKELRATGRTPVMAAELHGLLLNQQLLSELAGCVGAFDLVYERLSLWSFAGLQFARRQGLPFFLEVNAPLLAQQEEYRDVELVEAARAIERQLLSAADRVLVTSPALRDYARSHGASGRSIRILPCGVSTSMFGRAGDLGPRGRSEFVVGFLGTLKPWHGIDLLLEAFLQLQQRNAAYRLLIVGSGPLQSDIEEFRRRHHLESVMTLTGNVPHARVADSLARMDVGVAPYPPLSEFYFSPLKIWEYAAAGLPIVASASGNIPVLFPHRSAALLHRPGSVRKIVEHIERIRRDPELGRRLARRARRVAKLHTWDRLAARLESIARTGGVARQQS